MGTGGRLACARFANLARGINCWSYLFIWKLASLLMACVQTHTSIPTHLIRKLFIYEKLILYKVLTIFKVESYEKIKFFFFNLFLFLHPLFSFLFFTHFLLFFSFYRLFKIIFIALIRRSILFVFLKGFYIYIHFYIHGFDSIYWNYDYCMSCRWPLNILSFEF